jgi:RHS repeat-associated protein
VVSITVDGTTSVLASGEYFPFGAVKKWVWGNGEPYQRTFDLDGRVSSLTLGPSSATYPDLAEAFTYDSLNRIINANLAAGQTQSFTYDANGNRTNATINAASTTYTYPSTSHRLTSLSGAATRSFTYDNAGNVATSAGITYTYDGRGRMKQAGTTTYAVNGLGQRVKKNNGSDTFFAYDEAAHLIGEYDATGAPIEETVWLGDLPVAVLKPKTGGFDVFYVWADHLGTPRQITDTTNQSRWEWPNADPFGNNLPNENPAGVGVFSYNLRFPGQYYDVEKGSNYNYFRDYDPSIGRYVESDPIGLKAGWNAYAYVEARPVMRRDPFGLATCSPGDAMCDIAMNAAGLPVPRPFDSPCGADGGMKFPQFGFGKACEAHDKCYDGCGASKALCDLHFLANMQISCGIFGAAACRIAAIGYYDGVAFFGGGAFNAAQKNACPGGKCRQPAK